MLPLRFACQVAAITALLPFPTLSNAESCAIYGEVVVSRVPRMTMSAGKICWQMDDGRILKHGSLQRRWDAGRSPVRALYGYFENGRPVGVWKFVGTFGVIVVGFNDDGSPQFVSHLATLDGPGPVPPYWSVMFEAGEPSAWNLLPGTYQHRYGQLAKGKPNGSWGDALNPTLGTYEMGRLTAGERAPPESVQAVKAAKLWLSRVAEYEALTKAEMTAIHAEEAAVNTAAPPRE